jgi:asparagine synthase (glutamine-hydrolysing)
MCSISGFIDFKEPHSQEFLKKLNNTMSHRGPDDQGYYIDNNVGFAHNRLSILDLSSAGHQPMESECGRFVICYNGEIYNHNELRKRFLPGRGFKGHSDTETLIELISCFYSAGKNIENVLKELNGMFAFAFWDKKEQTLLLVRDRMGIKPLYLYRKGGFTAFASEIKAFSSAGLDMSLSQEGIETYFTYGHSTMPSTIYLHVNKLLPGSFMSISNRKVENRYYWELHHNTGRFAGSYSDAVCQLKSLISDSVRLRLISDVPFGAFLSGGIDSSTITVLMQKYHGSPVNTFSVGFDFTGNKTNPAKGGKYSELPDARAVSKQIGSIHHELTPTADDLINIIEKLVYHYDEPYGDPAAFPTYMVSYLAKKYVTVCHSGEGADELFGGYRRYLANLWFENHIFLSRLYSAGFTLLESFLPRMRKLRKISQAFKENDAVKRYSCWLETLEKDTFFRLTGSKIKPNEYYSKIYELVKSDPGQFILLADQSAWLVDGYLEKVDKASMACSLEARVPFLDHRIVEFANSLPVKWKIGRTTKLILKNSTRGILPDNIIDKPKRGFTVPLDEWFRNELKKYCQDLLFASDFNYSEFNLNRKTVESCFNDHLKMRKDYSSFIWQMLIFIIWSNQRKKQQINKQIREY